MFDATITLPPPPPRRKPVAGSLRPPGNPYFPLPLGCKRLLVLSNVEAGFRLPPLQDGDCLIHFNRAKHFQQALELGRFRERVRHVLFVRGEDAEAGLFFWPPALKGFSAVVTIRAHQYNHLPWWTEYRKAGGANPSSGFAIANLLRHYHPTLPIWLVGFSPGTNASFRAPVHQWSVEAAWLAAGQGEFRLYPLEVAPPKPIADLRLRLLICTCKRYRDRRDAQRATWLTRLPGWVSYTYFMGGEEPPDPDETDVLWLPGVDDSYLGLPTKVMAAFRKASEDDSWTWLGKLDDDAYLVPERLLPVLQPPAEFVGRARRGGKWAPGGPGYFMTRPVLTDLLAHADQVPPTGAEDYQITGFIASLGHKMTDCRALLPYRSEGFPTPDNDAICTSNILPEMMLSHFPAMPPDARPTVHQIWVGTPLPDNLAKWVEGIRSGATAAGWEHRLWDWPALRDHFAKDPLTPSLATLMELAPEPRTYGLVSDYYRFAILAEPYGAGSMYLDTDFVLDGPWPDLPTEADLYLMTERTNTNFRASGAFWLPPRHSNAPFATALQALRKRFAEVFPSPLTADAINRVYAHTSVLNIFGPHFLRRVPYRQWDANLVRATFFPFSLLSHSTWHIPSRLYHFATASWKIC